jgi:hypothetical protein
MPKLPNSPLKFKAIMLSNDGGKNLVRPQAILLMDLGTSQFLDEELLGTRLATKGNVKQHQLSGSLTLPRNSLFPLLRRPRRVCRAKDDLGQPNPHMAPQGRICRAGLGRG